MPTMTRSASRVVPSARMDGAGVVDIGDVCAEEDADALALVLGLEGGGEGGGDGALEEAGLGFDDGDGAAEGAGGGGELEADEAAADDGDAGVAPRRARRARASAQVRR